MGVSRKLLTEGEEVVVSVRAHVKVLLGPVVLLLVACASGGFLAAAAADVDSSGVLVLVVLAAAAGAILAWVVKPFLSWATTTYTITTQRLIEQRGILTRSGRVIPLRLVNDVAFEKGLDDRLLGCGTLVVSNASDQDGLRLPDVPQVSRIHRTLSTLVFDLQRSRSSDERV